MLSTVFERAYGKLVGAFVRYDDAKTAHSDFSSFATAWLALDDARIEMRQVHADMPVPRPPARGERFPKAAQDRAERELFQVRHLSS